MSMTIWSICIKFGQILSENGLTFFGKLHLDNSMSATATLNY